MMKASWAWVKKGLFSSYSCYGLGLGFFLGAKGLERHPALQLIFTGGGLVLALYGSQQLRKEHRGSQAQNVSTRPANRETVANLRHEHSAEDEQKSPVQDEGKRIRRSWSSSLAFPRYLRFGFVLFTLLSCLNTIFPPAIVMRSHHSDSRRSPDLALGFPRDRRLDIFDEVDPDWKSDAGYEAGRQWIWDVGDKVEGGGVVYFDWVRFLNRELFFLLGGVLSSVVLLKVPRVSDLLICWGRRWGWVIPLLTYAVFAVRSLLFVPCYLVVRRAFEYHPERLNTYNLWVWQIDRETIRYSLVAYREVALLTCLLLFYGIAIFVFPHARQTITKMFANNA
jgi:hypothetical protein